MSKSLPRDLREKMGFIGRTKRTIWMGSPSLHHIPITFKPSLSFRLYSLRYLPFLPTNLSTSSNCTSTSLIFFLHLTLTFRQRILRGQPERSPRWIIRRNRPQDVRRNEESYDRRHKHERHLESSSHNRRAHFLAKDHRKTPTL